MKVPHGPNSMMYLYYIEKQQCVRYCYDCFVYFVRHLELLRNRHDRVS